MLVGTKIVQSSMLLSNMLEDAGLPHQVLNAVLHAQEAQIVAGAGLDVFENEPPRADHPLRNHPRVLPTPHVSGVTDGSLVNMGVMAAECIAAALTGGVVPPERIVRA